MFFALLSSNGRLSYLLQKDETIKELQDAASGLKKYIDRMEVQQRFCC